MVFAALLPTSEKRKPSPPPPPPPPPPKAAEEKADQAGPTPWHIILSAAILTIFGTLFMDCMSNMMLVPLLPYLSRDLGASVPQVGFAILASQLTQVPGSVFLGFLADKYGCKNVLVTAIVLYGVTYVACGLATDYWQLLFARLVTGIFASSRILCVVLVAKIVPKKHFPEVMGVGAVPAGAAHLLGPAMSGLLSALSYSAPLFISAGLCWFNALCAQVFLPTGEAETEDDKSVEAPPPVTLAAAWKMVVKNPALILLYVAAFCEQACFIGIVEMAALFFQDVFNMSSTETGIVIAVGGANMFLGVLINGPLSRWVGCVGTVTIGCSLRALASFALVGVRAKPTAWVLFSAYLLAEPMINSGLFGLVEDLVMPEYHGSAFGCVGAFKGAGFVAGVLGSSFLYAKDINLPFIAFGACQALVIPLIIATVKGLSSRPTPRAEGLLTKQQGT